MNRALPPSVAVAAGLAAAIAIALVPAWRIEAVVSDSGLPALLPAAAPPLGWTARGGLMLLVGLFVAIPVWIALTLLGGSHRLSLTSTPSSDEGQGGDDAVAPSVRRADAHPDAPPRPPVRAARDLGSPFLDPVEPVEPEIALPRDLDTPMAMFDPLAVPQVPAAPPPTVRPLFRPSVAEPVPEDAPVMAVEPMVEATPTPGIEPPSPPPPEPAPQPSIGVLLDRLDDGLRRRRRFDAAMRADPVAPAPGLASTLGALRRMAGGE